MKYVIQFTWNKSHDEECTSGEIIIRRYERGKIFALLNCDQKMAGLCHHRVLRGVREKVLRATGVSWRAFPRESFYIKWFSYLDAQLFCINGENLCKALRGNASTDESVYIYKAASKLWLQRASRNIRHFRRFWIIKLLDWAVGDERPESCWFEIKGAIRANINPLLFRRYYFEQTGCWIAYDF